MTGFADNDANQVFNVRRFGKRAKIQPNNGFFQPLLGMFWNSMGIDMGSVSYGKSLCELFLKSIQVYGCESKP